MPDPVRSVLFIDAEDDASRASPPQATFGPPSALSMIASRKKVRIPIAGKLVVVPSWDFGAMQELLRTAYILDGWVGVETVGRGLDLVKKAVTDPTGLVQELDRRGTSPLESLFRGLALPAWRPPAARLPVTTPLTLFAELPPPGFQGWVRELRQDLTLADVWLIDAAKREYERGRDRLGATVVAVAAGIEMRATELIQDRLAKSKQQVEAEGLSIFPQLADAGDAGAAFAMLASSRTLSIPSRGPKADALKALRACLAQLEPAATAVLDAEKQLHEGEALRALEHIRERGEQGPAPPGLQRFDKTVAAAQRQLEERRADLAVQVAQWVGEFPVISRVRPNELVDAVHKNDDAAVCRMVFEKLQQTWKAADELAGRLPKKGAHARAARQSPHSRVEDDIAAASDDTAWTFPKTIDAALAALPTHPGEQVASDATPGSLEYAVASRVLQAIRQRRSQKEFVGTLVAITEFGVVHALTAVCPPAGFAVNVIYSTWEAWGAVQQYGADVNAHLCTLDPSQALAEAPSVLPVALSVAGALLSVATPPKLPNPASLP